MWVLPHLRRQVSCPRHGAAFAWRTKESYAASLATKGVWQRVHSPSCLHCHRPTRMFYHARHTGAMQAAFTFSITMLQSRQSWKAAGWTGGVKGYDFRRTVHVSDDATKITGLCTVYSNKKSDCISAPLRDDCEKRTSRVVCVDCLRLLRTSLLKTKAVNFEHTHEQFIWHTHTQHTGLLKSFLSPVVNIFLSSGTSSLFVPTQLLVIAKFCSFEFVPY